MLVAPPIGAPGDIILTAFATLIKFSAWVMAIYLFRMEFRIYIPNIRYRIQHTIRMNFGIALNAETPIFKYMSYRFWCTFFCLIAQTSHAIELGLVSHYRYVNLMGKDLTNYIFDDSICWFYSCDNHKIAMQSLSIIFNLPYWISCSLLMNTSLYRYTRMHLLSPQQSKWIQRFQSCVWVITLCICVNICMVNSNLDKKTIAIIHVLNLGCQGSLSLLGVGIDIVLSIKMIFISLNYDYRQSLPNCGTDRAPSTLTSPDVAGGPSRLPPPSDLKKVNLSEESTNSFNSSRNIQRRLGLKRDMLGLYVTLATFDILVIIYFVINAIFWIPGDCNHALYILTSWLAFHIFMSFMLLDYFGKSVSEIRRRRYLIHVPERDKESVQSLIAETVDIISETDLFPTVSLFTFMSSHSEVEQMPQDSSIKKRTMETQQDKQTVAE